MKSYRTISVGGCNYKWKVGRRFVDIRPEEGARMTPTIAQVTGLSEDNVERAQWKRYLTITPQQIREHIEKAVKNE